MKNEENICQYCKRQRAITTLTLNACWNKCSKCYLKCYQVLSYHRACLIQLNTNLAEANTGSTFLTCLYFYFHFSIWIFCTLFICLALDGLLQWICFRMFCSKHSITFWKLVNTKLLNWLCWHILYQIYIPWNFHSNKFRD